ncbi:microtubule-associated protein Jupiter [Onthophagus taurus]|uniref:microtubule-associated protein Jupiter n=1 Tax=Onthophagus taurus TaxID=166361 RepID=UPI000C1FDEFE|nr:microtubule-associated protein Jupiter [Onthophagus taurus]
MEETKDKNDQNDGSKKASEESLTETVMERKETFDSEQSLTNDQSRKLSSDTNISKKEENIENRQSSSSGPPQISQHLPTQRRLNKLRDHSSTVFPAGCMGCPENPPSDQICSPRRLLDPVESKEQTGLIDNMPKKRPSSAKPLPFIRNPLTGVGMDVEEVKRLPRRREGNPLLGEGYDCEIKPTPNTSNGRIPPGGYSKGLW